jgi:hypothetical protein
MRTVDISAEPRRLDAVKGLWLGSSVVTAVVGMVGALALATSTEGGIGYLLETYLVSYALLLSLSLGGLFFVMLQHVTRSGWSVVVRRISEGVAANVALMAILAIPILWGMDHLYHWSHADAVAQDPILAGKSGFLNPTFFVVRLAVYFVVWIALAWFFYRTSIAQDSSGDPNLTRRMERLSAPGLVLFALSINFAAFDLLMSLDPHWFSTIYGVYYFSASVVCFCAVMPKILAALQWGGVLTRAVTVEHYHDFGKLLFAFVVFWAYIAFSQFMLIWYGNMPEETGWYLKRQTGDWAWISLTLLFGHFVIPFLLLVSRYVKRRPRLLAATGIYMVVMCWIDIYWLVVPEFSPGVARFGLVDIFCGFGLVGVYSTVLFFHLRRSSLVPERDPRLHESLTFENA